MGLNIARRRVSARDGSGRLPNPGPDGSFRSAEVKAVAWLMDSSQMIVR